MSRIKMLLRMHFNFHRTIFWTQLSFLVWTFPIFWALLWAATCSRSTCLLTTGPLEKTLWRETLFRRWNPSFPAPAWSSSACKTTKARSPKIESARKAHTAGIMNVTFFFKVDGYKICNVRVYFAIPKNSKNACAWENMNTPEHSRQIRRCTDFWHRHWTERYLL